MIVDCAHYRDGSRQHEGPLSVEDAAKRREADDLGFVWLGLYEPDEQEMAEVAERFDLPELAVEDAMQAHQRPKLEDYGKSYFLVVHTARYIDEREEVEFGEVHVFGGPGYVIIVRHGEASELHTVRERLEQNPELLREGPPAAVWAVLDKIVDDYEPVIQGLDNDVEEVEVAVFQTTDTEDQSRRIYFLRRELAEFYRAVHPLLLALDQLESANRAAVSAVLREHLRDVEDHLKRIEEELITQRELLSSILQANLSVVAVQQNDVVKRISSWAAVIAVPTLVASIYGMNFKNMPELRWTYGYPYALGLMIVVGVVLHRLFRRAGWL
ncbi:MAG: magnesium transporter [Solirubrobacteraceae bacterium]|nr:magnesium transporter [Solirubrobacteraceae bacterium]